MFGHKETGKSRQGYVVGVRKGAVDAYVLVDTGSGIVQADVTRPMFDIMGIRRGSEVLVSGSGDDLRIRPLG